MSKTYRIQTFICTDDDNYPEDYIYFDSLSDAESEIEHLTMLHDNNIYRIIELEESEFSEETLCEGDA